MDNKKVIIRCVLSDRLNNSCHHILVFSDKKELLFDGYTDMRGFFGFEASYFGVYKVIILIRGNLGYEIRNIFVRDDRENSFIFMFYNDINLHAITILVTDENYCGLPIKEGEIFLWLKNT